MQLREKVVERHVLELTPDNFEEEVLASKTPVLCDFWAPWCGPCRTLAPTLERVAASVSGIKFVKLNTEAYPDFSPYYNIRGLPTMVMFKDGKEVDRLQGAHGQAKIEELCRKYAGASQVDTTEVTSQATAAGGSNFKSWKRRR